jgi:hypothetical protein
VSKRERDKGLRGELEVAHILAEHGLALRNLERSGDQLVYLPTQDAWLHVECKRQERLCIPEWNRQAASEAPEGTTPVVCYRRSREPWYVSLPLDQFLDLVDGRR